MSDVWQYAPAPESRDLVDVRSEYGLFIDGEFVEPATGETFKTVNPATEEVLAAVSVAGPHDIDRAVTAARVSPARSSRGTSRCSWPRGSWRLRWPPATHACSSRRRPRR